MDLALLYLSIKALSFSLSVSLVRILEDFLEEKKKKKKKRKKRKKGGGGGGGEQSGKWTISRERTRQREQEDLAEEQERIEEQGIK